MLHKVSLRLHYQRVLTRLLCNFLTTRIDTNGRLRFYQHIKDCSRILRLERSAARTADQIDAYKEWCADTNETAGTQKLFGGKLGERGFEKVRTKAGVVYRGIRLMRSELTTGGAPVNDGCTVNGGEPKSGIDGHAQHSHGVNQEKVHRGTQGTREEVRAAVLDTFDALGIKTSEPDTIAKVLYESGALPYAPSTELVETVRKETA